jgi:hypothetical protein
MLYHLPDAAINKAEILLKQRLYQAVFSKLNQPIIIDIQLQKCSLTIGVVKT